MRDKIPDPSDEGTFLASKLDWDSINNAPLSRQFLALTKELLSIREQRIVPLIKDGFTAAKADLLGSSKKTGGLDVRWRTHSGEELQIIANFSGDDLEMPNVTVGHVLWASGPRDDKVLRPDQIYVRRTYYAKRL
jgi:maltooligosyltrehalose trehalohydrolase